MSINRSVAERQHQVVIVGGGTAGWVAALAAARNGADVFVIERRQHFGGNLSSGLPILGSFNVQSQQIVKGIADELVQRLIPLRGSDGYQLYDLWASSMVALEPIVVKSVIQQMLEEAGVSFLFAAQATDVVVEDNRVVGLIVQKKSGRESVKARIYIDATGDAEVAYQAGAPVRLGAEATGAMQPPTLLFRLLNRRAVLRSCLLSAQRWIQLCRPVEIATGPVILALVPKSQTPVVVGDGQIGIEGNGPVQVPDRVVVLAQLLIGRSAARQRRGHAWIELQRPVEILDRARILSHRRPRHPSGGIGCRVP